MLSLRNRLSRRPSLRIRRIEVALFARQLASMLGSGVGLVSALTVLAEQSESADLRQVLERVTGMVNSGIRLSVAVHEYPTVFSRVFVVMIQIGEQSGQLETMLERLADWLERDEQLRQRIVKALTYPAFVCALAVVLTLMLFYTVVPSFLGIFADMHVPLPLPTRIVKLVADGVSNPVVWVLGLALLSLLSHFYRQFQRRPGAWCGPYSWLRRLPVLGRLLECGALARFGSTLGVLLQAGSDLPRALRLSVQVSGQPLWERKLDEMIACISQGDPLSEFLQQHPELFPSTLTQMILAGEEAACLEDMALRAGAYYELETGFHIDALSSLLEPLLLASVSLLVGSVVIALFLPLYSFLSQLGL